MTNGHAAYEKADLGPLEAGAVRGGSEDPGSNVDLPGAGHVDAVRLEGASDRVQREFDVLITSN